MKKILQNLHLHHNAFRDIGICFLIICGISVGIMYTRPISSVGQKKQLKNIPVHSTRFYDEGLFQNGIAKTQSETLSFRFRVVSGIVPHHILAASILSDFFSKLAVQKPKRIILIGPDHHETGISRVITSRYAWSTPYGVVYPDISVDSLTHNYGILADEVTSEMEHSIGSITPYIAYYLPNTNIIPIIISARIGYDEILRASSIISTYVDNDTVVLASVDFSHGLISAQAQERDIVTEGFMKEFSYKQLFSLNSEYLDSPASVIIALRVGELLQSKQVEVLAHTNSGMLQNNPTMQSTSYYSIALHE